MKPKTTVQRIQRKVFSWTAESVRRKMKAIAKAEKCQLEFMTSMGGYGGFNYAASSGNQIMLAPFLKVEAGSRLLGHTYVHGCDNPVECQFISFFHELAHIRLTDNVPSIVKGYTWNDTSAYQFELWITMLGIEYAHSKYGIKFSDEAVQWMLDEAKSYAHGTSDDFGYSLASMNVTQNGYQVLSQWEFKGKHRKGEKK